MDKVLKFGVKAIIERGFVQKGDLEKIEAQGSLE
jgi:hypothetical protein